MKYTPFLVVIPYLASAAQGRELEYAIAGWRRHFKEDFLIVLTGENLPHIDGDDIVLVESKRVPNVDGQYRQHLDYVSCFKKVRQRFPDSQGFIFVADDCYAINDFDLVDILIPKFLERNLGGFHIDSPNGWRVDKAKTRCALVDGGYPQMNYTTHLPIWFDWDKIEELWEKYDMLHQSFVIEDLYYNIFESDISPVDIKAPNKYKFGVYNNNPSTIDNLHREAKNVIWVTNSPEGWTKLLDEFLSEYYFPNLIPFAD